MLCDIVLTIFIQDGCTSSSYHTHHFKVLSSQVLLCRKQVLGNAKGVLASIVSVLFFNNSVTFKSILGYTVTLVGVLLYSQVILFPRPIRCSKGGTEAGGGGGASDMSLTFTLSVEQVLPVRSALQWKNNKKRSRTVDWEGPTLQVI